MSTLRVDNLNARTGTTISVPTGTKLYAPGGIVQVLQTVKTDVFSTTSTSFVDVTGLSVVITPTSLNSKILIIADVKGQSGDNATSRLMRDSTPIYVGTASGSRTVSSGNDFYGAGSPGGVGGSRTITYLDSPSTLSAVTYKVQVWCRSSSYTLYVNTTYNDTDASYTMRGASSITVLEIAQ